MPKENEEHSGLEVRKIREMLVIPNNVMNRAHVFHDLRPYVCTYVDCKYPNQHYERMDDWIKHEVSENDFGSRTLLRSDGDAPAPQTVDPASRTCPLCIMKHEPETGIYKHVARHLERIALFALPRSREDEQEEDTGNKTMDSDSAKAAFDASEAVSSLSKSLESIESESSNDDDEPMSNKKDMETSTASSNTQLPATESLDTILSARGMGYNAGDTSIRDRIEDWVDLASQDVSADDNVIGFWEREVAPARAKKVRFGDKLSLIPSGWTSEVDPAGAEEDSAVSPKAASEEAVGRSTEKQTPRAQSPPRSGMGSIRAEFLRIGGPGSNYTRILSGHSQKEESESSKEKKSSPPNWGGGLLGMKRQMRRLGRWGSSGSG
jgi:hypothetical protein